MPQRHIDDAAVQQVVEPSGELVGNGGCALAAASSSAGTSM
jgi:hypothetical protein